MTEEQILEIAQEHLDGWVSLMTGDRTQIIRFAQAIRRDALYEAIQLLSNVPNPEANRTAINRITMELN